MASRKPIKLSWEGKEYKTIVNMLLIGRIDDEIGILKLMRMEQDNPKIVIIIKLVHILLEEAGLNISLEDVYDGLGDKIDPADLFTLLSEITPMILPNFNGIAKKSDHHGRKARPRKNRSISLG